MTRILQLSAALCCLSLAWLAYRASLAADAVTRAAVEAPQAVLSVVTPALGIVDARTAYVADMLAVNLARLDQLANRTERDATQAIAAITATADRRTGDALAIVKDAAALTITEVQGIRADLKPTIDSIAPAVASAKALTDEAKASWDANYFDIQATIANLTVATAGIGRASDEVAKAAPKLSESTVQMGQSAAGIAADVHTATSDFVRPKTFWQHVKAWLETSGKIAARLL